MPLDITNLSDKTYTAIIEEAINFNDALAEQFDMLSGHCADEKEFINQSMDLANGMLTYDDDEIEELFSEEPISKPEFHQALKRIISNIEGLSD